MKPRFTLFRRGGVYYSQDHTTGQQTSLRTKDAETARLLVHARNEAFRQPMLNLQIARTYLWASDPQMVTRTWQVVMDEMGKTKQGPTKKRFDTGVRDTAFDLIRKMPLLETQAHHFLQVLSAGTVSTNMFLVRLHNFALQMNWLPWPILAKKGWPKISFREKRAITWEEHQAILRREENPEKRAYFECCWHLGGAQTDIASLTAENIDWENRIVSFHRRKTGTPSIIRFGEALERVLRELPRFGPLFPSFADKPETDRSRIFRLACRRARISGVTLHSYRYAWAERAKTVGYPERFAQEALGHRSKAVHRAYARKAQVTLPPLEEYERNSKATAPQPAAHSAA
jgi:integrase